ncbi:MAG: sulfide/dihydroorotate dehydrogenase-like FAD/NAD-binding protein [Candidatus Marinimicrobia bacterium]|jgi:ferredoxin--NADP+ reductase|nr:sulfide/dihydroorotate dehydrogenase-like FAD/NAD-binding protein [Candidatus Neomarinimicrobiota bacterium]
MKHIITRKEDLNSADFVMDVIAPEVAKRFKPGNFAVLLTIPNGERIPMSIEKAEDGKITMYIKKLGKTSRELDTWKVGDAFYKIIGPMGTAPTLKKFGTVVFASDLVCGHAENNAMCRELKKIEGNHVISIQSFPTKDDIYPEKELSKKYADEYILATEDGSAGKKGHYLDIIQELLEERKIDQVFAGGGIPPLQKLSELTKKYNVPVMTTVRQIMVDATGMCGSCRVFVGGEQKLACIDGPMFDGQKVDWKTAISRLAMFKNKEAEAMECYNKEIKELK